MMQENDQQSSRVLVVDDDAASTALVSRHLSKAGYEVLTATTCEDALKILVTQGAPIVITDWMMPGMTGLELCRAIREHEGIMFAFVIILTAQSGDDHLVEAFSAGADDYLTKPLNYRELLARIRAGQRILQLQQDLESKNLVVHRFNAEMAIAHTKLAEANEQLNRLATTDELTGLLNRREAMSRLSALWSTAQRHASPLSCVSLDIDHFKSFNDVYGHAVGDTVLRATADSLRATVRNEEYICRVGGEEFLLLCPQSTEAEAAVVAERLRKTVEERIVRIDGLELSVTISLGVAERTKTMAEADELLRAADDALYAAKDTGRNRVCKASDVSSVNDSESAGKETTLEPYEPPQRSDGQIHSMTVLLADGDGTVRTTCRKILQQAGYEVDLATTGTDALERIRKTSPDVVIMAAKLPDVSGLDCTQSLKNDPNTQDIPVILAAARTDALDADACLEAGADEFINKPINAKELLVRVESMSRFHDSKKDLIRSNQVRGEQSWILGLLLDFYRSLTTAGNLDEVFDRTTTVVLQLMSSQRAAILLLDPREGVLRIAKSFGVDEERANTIAMRMGEGVSGRVFATGKVLVMNEPRSPKGSAPDDAMLFGDAPWVCVPLSVSDQVIGVMNVGKRHGCQEYGADVLEYIDLVCGAAAAAIHDHLSRQSRDSARDSIVFALAKLAEYRDSDTGAHLERVTSFCRLLAEQLRHADRYRSMITDDYIADLKRAVPLHDIGKVAIPDSILNKPGKLTSLERSIIQTHAEIGATTIRSVLQRTPGVSFLEMATQIAHCHHEWYDGRGYPRGLAASDIPLPARIVAVADVYDAITTRRVYKDALPHEEAANVIYESSGLQFDPDVVEAFRLCEDDFEQLARELIDTTEESAEITTQPSTSVIADVPAMSSP